MVNFKRNNNNNHYNNKKKKTKNKIKSSFQFLFQEKFFYFINWIKNKVINSLESMWKNKVITNENLLENNNNNSGSNNSSGSSIEDVSVVERIEIVENNERIEINENFILEDFNQIENELKISQSISPTISPTLSSSSSSTTTTVNINTTTTVIKEQIIFHTPFHYIPIDVIASTLIRFIPMPDIANLMLCSHDCYELFKESARKSCLLLLNYRRIKVGPFINRCDYILPTSINSSYLPILWTLRNFISLMSKQSQLIDYQYISRLQNTSILGYHQYLDEHMRSSVIDWMIEVSVEFKFLPSILHYSVFLLDQILSHVSIPRRFFQLLGCVSLYLISRPTRNPIPMDLDDIIYMCDSQYSIQEVLNMIQFIEKHFDHNCYNLFVLNCSNSSTSSFNSSQQNTTSPMNNDNGNNTSNNNTSQESPTPSVSLSSSLLSFSSSSSITSTISSSTTTTTSSSLPIYSPNLILPQFRISLSSPTIIHFLASMCHSLQLPLVMYQYVEVSPSISSSTFNSSIPNQSSNFQHPSQIPTPTTAEHILLLIFFSDLSLLDYIFLQHTPFTLSCAIICLTRLTLYYYGQSKILLTPYGIAEGKSREIKQLLRDSNCRFYIEPDSNYLEKSFGLVWLEDFILQNHIERNAVRFCIERLWYLHADYFGYLSYLNNDNESEQTPYTPYILHYHSHIFAGLKEKYHSSGSCRDSIWNKLKMIPKQNLSNYLNQIFNKYS